ncbi:hypothetical protein B0H13DRAFT_1850061 [Mycena leptocephala]|nr:hypothetical protein B0H13DRAFT_1850061 [Mycena leptocephala]
MSAPPKKSPPAHKLPMNDGNSKSHHMILALCLPTGAPEELRTLFRNGAAACDGVRADDENHETENSQIWSRNFPILLSHASTQHFDVTEWIGVTSMHFQVTDTAMPSGNLGKLGIFSHPGFNSVSGMSALRD